MRAVSSIVPFLLPLAAYAAPAPAPAAEAVEERGILDPVLCLLNNLLVGLRNDPLAVPYCSSVLGIRPLTATAGVVVTVAPTITSTINIGGGTASFTIGRTANTVVTSTTTATTTTTTTIVSTTSVSTISCLDAAYTAPVGRRDVLAQKPALEKRQTIGVLVGVTPTVIPPSAQPGQIQTACSCLGLTTNTITVTPTVTAGVAITSLTSVNLGAAVSLTITLDVTSTETVVETATVTATATSIQNVVGTTLANPSGLRFKKFTHPFSAFENQGPPFDVNYFKTAAFDFEASAVSPRIGTPGWPYGGYSMTIGGQTFDSSSAALVFHGFYVARATGSHVFSSSGDTIDNWGFLWTGNAAFTTYDGTNFAFRSMRVDGTPYTGGQTSIQMNEGDAIPITWLWANGGGVGNSDFTVTSPGGISGGQGNFIPACNVGTFF